MSIVSLIERAITDPLSLHRILLLSIKILIEKAQYHRHGPDDLFHEVVERLEWGHRNRDQFIHCWFFLCFYVNFPEFRRMVDEAEKIAYPGTSEVTLSFMVDAMGQVMEDVQMSAFDQSNIVGMATKFRELLQIYALHRPATFLTFPGFNPKIFIDTSDHVKAFPPELLQYYESNRLKSESLRRTVTKMDLHPPDSIQWRSIVDTIARQQPVLQHMAVYLDGHRVKRREVMERELKAVAAKRARAAQRSRPICAEEEIVEEAGTV